MQIRTGYEIAYECPAPTPMVLMLSVHPSRFPDLLTPQEIRFDPWIPSTEFRDIFGNVCYRIVAPAGRLTIASELIVGDPGTLDAVATDARQLPIEELPDEVLMFLLGSRYCETDRFLQIAWSLFGHTQPGWARVQAICDYVHERITFGYQFARPTKSAWDGHAEQQGVCRDFAHLAVTLCRCMNIPARYCTGYLGDIGVPPVNAPMDFSAWFEVYLGGHWHTFDARHNVRRIGRVLMARGRDASDVAIVTSFGPCNLAKFSVITDELPAREGLAEPPTPPQAAIA